MNSNYLEGIAVGIVTAVLAGFAGVGAHRTASVIVPPATSAPQAAVTALSCENPDPDTGSCSGPE
jgi:hypothetical protein